MRPESHETLCPIVLVCVLPEDTELCGPPPMIFNRVSTQDQRGRTLGSRTQDLFDPNAKGLRDPQIKMDLMLWFVARLRVDALSQECRLLLSVKHYQRS